MLKSPVQMGKTYFHKCPEYDSKPSEGESPVLKFGECEVPLLSGPLWPGLVIPVRFPSMVQMELFSLLLGIIINIK